MEKQPEQEINYTELLMREYGDDPMAMNLAEELRTELHDTDETIYHFLESFY